MLQTRVSSPGLGAGRNDGTHRPAPLTASLPGRFETFDVLTLAGAAKLRECRGA
jgi:hypothetical protein